MWSVHRINRFNIRCLRYMKRREDMCLVYFVRKCFLTLSSKTSVLSQLAMKTTLAVVVGFIWTSLGTAIEIDTNLGQIQGNSTSKFKSEIHQFLNIPYAEPPGTPYHVASFKMPSFDFLLITTTVSTQSMICDGDHQNHWQPPHGKKPLMVQSGVMRVCR